MKKIKKLLFTHEVTQMPKEMRRKKNLILTTTITSTIVLDILSFAIKGAQSSLVAGYNYLALALMLLYFIRQVLQSTVQTFVDSLKNQFNSQSDAYITTSISDVSNTVRGKVFREQADHALIMSNAEVIYCMKQFVNYIWTFLQNFPIVISNTLIAMLMSALILITEFVQTGDIKLTFLFSGILVTCILLFGLLYKARINVRNKYRGKNKMLQKENEILMNDVKNIEPLIKNEFSYRVKLVVENLKNSRLVEKVEFLFLNSLHVLRTIVLAGFMVAIIIIKLSYAGGIENLTIAVLTDIIAISTVYSNILDKIAAILNDFEKITNTLKDAEKIKEDVDNIMTVYKVEKSTTFESHSNISCITVEPFEFSYPGQITLYTLRNTSAFRLEHGKSYLVHGHTGCGKSTFMHLLIGKIRMDSTPISYGNSCKEAYLSSIMHESNGRLGANPVLQELIFDKDISTLHRDRMLDILHGTHIYEDVMRNLGLTIPNDEKVFKYLNSTTIDQYSSGQKQRLAIVKVLYNLDESHQIVVFDEATNALDDQTAISVLKYMADYCQKDKKRIVLFVSHQVSLTKDITDGNISFISETFPIYDIKATV